jgi:type I site-specific restriction endonuclease
LERYLSSQEEIIKQPYFIGDKAPRYYQQVAINRTVEAIAKGENRILLVMATGTGKTYAAFQIMYRLWKAKKKKRILFLADPIIREFEFFCNCSVTKDFAMLLRSLRAFFL